MLAPNMGNLARGDTYIPFPRRVVPISATNLISEGGYGHP
jgi:hypothetical protein